MARRRAIELMQRVGIPAPERRIDDYPHRLSGGMRQRAMIAMALACRPQLLIADEPTTALDVTIQAQILDLLRDLRRDRDMALILITHDLGVVAELCDEVVVMYGGKVVEHAAVDALFAMPQHPYTIGLLGSLPGAAGTERLAAIEGSPPNPLALPTGCRFHPRCPFAEPRCRQDEPPLHVVAANHHAACWRAPLEP
jgi:oligopeptide/dipeptide ABC transporter ATP-binding protein